MATVEEGTMVEDRPPRTIVDRLGLKLPSVANLVLAALIVSVLQVRFATGV